MANYVKFVRGTLAAWNNLPIEQRNNDTLYFITDASSVEGCLYLGNKLIAGGDNAPALNLSELHDVDIDAFTLSDASFLVFDYDTQKWVNKEPSQIVFKGASSAAMGAAGLVPAPSRGSENLFLRGDGTWGAANCSASLFEGTIADGETHDDVIARITENVTILNGDIAVVKELIAENNYQHTAYVFSQTLTKWVALDGNYSATNVYFNNDFVFTENVGTVKIPSTGSKEVSAKGKNVQEFLTGLFAASRNPDVTLPSTTLSWDGTAGPYEVGSTVTPKYKTTFNKGLYEFGPDTGVTATYAISDTNGKTATAASGSMPAFTVEDSTNYYITSVVTHTDGAVPKNNVGADVPHLAIDATTLGSKSIGPMKGYRKSFIGADNGTGPLTSDLIRSLVCLKVDAHGTTYNGFNYDGKKEYEVKAGDDTTRFIIAVPMSNKRAGLSSAFITTSMMAPAIDEYVKTENAVDVEGANDYTAASYKVWIYQPASITPGETHKITLA